MAIDIKDSSDLLLMLAEALEIVSKKTGVLADANANLKKSEDAYLRAIRDGHNDLTKEIADLDRARESVNKYQKALSDTTKETNALTKIKKDLHDAEIKIAESIGKTTHEVEAANLAYQKAKSVQEELQTRLKGGLTISEKIKKAEEDLVKSIKLGTLERDKARKALVELIKEQTKEDEQLKKAKKEAEGLKGKVSELVTAFSSFKSSISGTLGPISGFIGAMGAGSISMQSVISAGLKYNQTMFNVSRTQSVAGNSGKMLSSDIDALSKTTNLSTLQFLEFADTIQKSFVGIKPSMQEIAKLSINLATQFGPSLEAQKDASSKLLSIQNKFPDLYNKINEGIKLSSDLSRGKGNTGDEAKLKSLQSELLLRMSTIGISQEQQEVVLSATTKVTEAQMELNKTQEQSQKLSQEFGNAQREMWKSLEPLILLATKAATSFFKWVGDNKEVVLTLSGIASGVGLVTSALVIARVAMLAFGAATGPIGLIIGGVTLAAIGIAKWIAGTRKEQEEMEKVRKETEAEAVVQSKINNLTSKQKEEYNKILGTQDLIGKSSEDRRKIQLETVNEVTKEKSQANLLAIEMAAVRANNEANLMIIEKMTAGYRATSDAAAQFGGVSQNALSGIIKGSKETLKENEILLKKSMNNIRAQLEGQNIQVPVSTKTETSGQAEDMLKALQIEKERATTAEKRKSIGESISQLQQDALATTQSEANVAKSMSDQQSSITKQMDEQTSKYEARLDTERKLMEAAQFGMGASISMMQKQVDLAYEMIKVLKQEDSEREKALMDTKHITSSQMERIKNARTQQEAEKIIKEETHLQGAEIHQATQYAARHQELTKKEMDQQLKIYDLTKEIREGYLDAIREMASGAGEFEKIVGTQEMGVTQLMGAVDKFSKGALNTMKTGGMQSQESTAAGVGTEVTGRYQAGGGPMMSFLGGKEQESRNQRIYGYDKSKADYEKMRNGEQTSSQVGTALGAGEDNKYIRPAQEEKNITRDGTYEAIMKAKGLFVATSSNTNVMWGQNPGVSRAGFGTNERNNTNIGWSVDRLRSIQAPPSANPDGFVRQSSSGNTLTIPTATSAPEAVPSSSITATSEAVPSSSVAASLKMPKSTMAGSLISKAIIGILSTVTGNDNTALTPYAKQSNKTENYYNELRTRQASQLKEEEAEYYKANRISSPSANISDKEIEDMTNKITNNKEKPASVIPLSKKDDYVKLMKDNVAFSAKMNSDIEVGNKYFSGDNNNQKFVVERAESKKGRHLGNLNTEEVGNLSQNMRQSLGEFKRNKGESSDKYQSRIEKNLIHQAMEGGEKPWETMSPEARKQYQAAAHQAATQKYNKSDVSESARKGMVMETMKGAAEGHYESAAAKKGMEASAEGQAQFETAQMKEQRSDITGESAIGGGAGGNGTATILVQLSDELTGVVKDVQGILVQLQQSTSSKLPG